jgi:hypothetical protein
LWVRRGVDLLGGMAQEQGAPPSLAGQMAVLSDARLHRRRCRRNGRVLGGPG